jgi:hypothetical protein
MRTFKNFLIEAPLSGNSTNGTPNVKKYIIDNPKAMQIDFDIVKTNKDVPVYDDNGDIVSSVKFPTSFKLKSKRIIEIDGKPAVDTSIGIIPAKFVRKPSGFKAMDAEVFATNTLDGVIKKAVSENGGKGISVKIGKFTIKDVVGAGSDHIKGDPKADIALFSSSGKEVGFISHKKEGGAKGFSQYGGISMKSGLKHKEIESFIQAIENNYKSKKVRTALNGDAFFRPIKDPKLINASIYGPEYGSSFSRENCHCIGQGNPILSKKGKVWSLDFSETMHVNGDYRFATKGKFKAVFGATYRSGRKTTSASGNTVQNMRSGIYPIAYMETRKKVKEL